MKKKFILASVLAVGFTASFALTLIPGQHDLKLVKGDPVIYKLELNSTKNVLTTSTTYGNKTFVYTKTNLNNDVKFNGYGVKGAENCWAVLQNENSEIYNYDPICGLTKITIDVNGIGKEFKISYTGGNLDYFGDDWSHTFTTDGNPIEYDFDERVPNYFQITTTESDLEIKSIDLEYSCVDLYKDIHMTLLTEGQTDGSYGGSIAFLPTARRFRYLPGDTVQIKAIPRQALYNDSYIPEGWYIDDTKVCSDIVYEFTMPNHDEYITVKFIPETYENANGIVAQPLRNGENQITKVKFGRYPKSVVTDTDLIASLEEKAVLNTSSTGLNGYYEYKGEYYAKMQGEFGSKATDFMSTHVAVVEGKMYWFKVEPIIWDVIKKNGNTHFLLCESIIDNQPYNPETRSNYSESYIRTWLNGEFKNKAFYGTSVNLTGSGFWFDPFEDGYCMDGVYLLSASDMDNTSLFANTNARLRKGTDYSLAKSLIVNTSNYAFYLTRTNTNTENPDRPGIEYITNVSYDGKLGNQSMDSKRGVLPVIELSFYD